MWQIGENKYDQMATVWKVEDKGNYAEVQLSTSRKDKESGEYVNSGWSFVRFVGNAHKKIDELERGTRIVIKSGGISLEPYMKDGEKLYPKTPKIVVFAWGYPKKKEDDDGNGEDTVQPDTDDLPF